MMANKLSKIRYFIFPLKYLFPLLLLFAPHESIKAQGVNLWSEPALLFQINGDEQIHSPFVISDPYGNVHVFWSVISASPGGVDLIYYARLDAKGWTTPVDIVAGSPARAPRAAIGPDGYIYLIWTSSSGIFYSTAPVTAADIFKNWSKPVLLANSNIHASVITSPTGEIHIAFPGINQSGIFEQILEPNSVDWSSPRTISLNSLINTAADWVQIRASNNGTLHVVWTEFYLPDGWPPRGVFYSNSIDGGYNWSTPVLLAGEGYDQVNISVSDESNIHVAWNGQAGVGGRYHSWSSDGGQTWSETVEVIPAGVGGTEGPPQVLQDASSTVHMLTTHSGGCAWYTYFESGRWAIPICISGEKNLIEEPAMTVSEGNKLHAVFWEDRKKLWYTGKVTNALWIPPETIEIESPLPTQGPAPTDLPVFTPGSSTGLPLGQEIEEPSRVSFNPSQVLFLSLSPVLLVVILIIAISLYQKRK
jgi:hypothetical protein